MAARKAATRRRRSNGPSPELEDAEHQILFPFREVTLFGPGGGPGEMVVVRCWDQDTGVVATPHAVDLANAIAAKLGSTAKLGRSPTLEEIVRAAKPELERLLLVTLGWSQAEYRQKVHTYEEFLLLVDAMWTTCLERPGGGALPLIERLIAILEGVVIAAVGRARNASPSLKPSTASSVPGTPSPTSGG